MGENIEKVIARLMSAAEAVGPPGEEASVRCAVTDLAPLQDAHVRMLARMNGASFLSSYYRLFGIPPHARSLVEWNDPELWKFAWHEEMREYFCFGETAFADQFAVRYDGAPGVYRIDVSGNVTQISESFESFLSWLAFELHEEPQERVKAARRRFPSVPWDKHLQQAPPELLLGRFDPDLLRPMRVVPSMVAAGDLTRQVCGPQNIGRTVSRIETYTDQFNRGRLRVVWGDEKPRPS